LFFSKSCVNSCGLFALVAGGSVIESEIYIALTDISVSARQLV
jgi:hypothetical protein